MLRNGAAALQEIKPRQAGEHVEKGLTVREAVVRAKVKTVLYQAPTVEAA